MNERLGTELSAAARQVIAESRGADDPTAEDEARVKARWLAGIAAGAGVSSLSEAVRAAASTGWGLKAGALLAALAAATAGVYLGWPQLSESRRATPVAPSVAPRIAPSVTPPSVTPPSVTPSAGSVTSQVEPPPTPAPASANTPPSAELPPTAAPALAANPSDGKPVTAEETPAVPPSAATEPELPSRVAPPRARPAVVKVARTATPPRSVPARRALPEKAPAPPAEQPASAPALSGQLGEEIALLSDIRNNLQSGAAVRALDQLAAYRQRFGQPSLAMEADALQVDALCRAGQREAARAAASAFTSRWPGSPLQERVSAACP